MQYDAITKYNDRAVRITVLKLKQIFGVISFKTLLPMYKLGRANIKVNIKIACITLIYWASPKSEQIEQFLLKTKCF